MPGVGLGPWELIIILVIVLVIFGAGRLTDIGGALGKGIREFKSATRDDDGAEPATVQTTAAAPASTQTVVTSQPAAPAAAPSPAPTGTTCTSCGTVNPASQTFCGQCGARLTRAA